MNSNPEFPPPLKSWTDHIPSKWPSLVLLSWSLMIPGIMIKELVSERAQRMRMVTNEVSSKWGQVQTLAGPYISIPYYEEIKKSRRQDRVD
jgi:inner membrane protein